MRLWFVGQLLGATVEQPSQDGRQGKEPWGKVRLDDGMETRWVFCSPRQAEDAEPLIAKRVRVRVDVFDRAKDGRMTMRLPRDAAIQVLPGSGEEAATE